MRWIYAVDDYDWYVADNPEEAIQLAMRDSGVPREDYDEAVPVPLKSFLTGWVGIENDAGEFVPVRLWWWVLKTLVRGGLRKGFFSSTEY